MLHFQKSFSFISGCKENEQGSKSEDPEPELSRAADQDILPGEFPFFFIDTAAAKLSISLKHQIII